MMPYSSSDEDPDEDVAKTQTSILGMSGSRMLAVVAVVAVAATAVVGVVHGGTTTAMRAKSDHLFVISREEKKHQCEDDPDNTCSADPDPCACEPWLKLEQPTLTNLGKVSHPSQEEGMFFPGTYTDPCSGKPSKKVLLEMHAIPPWDGIDTHRCCNKLTKGEKYAMVTAKANTFIHVEFSVKDAETKEPVILRELDVTFFDLDMHESGEEVEYVKMFNVAGDILAKSTLIKKIENSTDGSITYKATKEGGPENNPDDPLKLTVEQKQLAVTIKYKDTDKFSAVLGSLGAGKKSWRGFIFVFRPTLKCARVDGNDPGIIETGPTTTTTQPTTTTVATTTTEKKKNCLFIVPYFEWCFPKFW